METALKRAINAGVDIVMVTNSSKPDKDLPGKLIAKVRAMVEAGEIGEGRIKAAYARIMRAKAKV